jgi:hypothetical protein
MSGGEHGPHFGDLSRLPIAALWASLAVTAVLVTHQLHHLERLVSALCLH